MLISRREPTKQKYTLTEEHEREGVALAERWTANSLRTDPMTDIDRRNAAAALGTLYRETDLQPPKNEVFCASPITAVLAGSIASGVWWLRENDDDSKLFGRPLTEGDILAARDEAVSIAVRCGWRVLMGTAPVDPETFKAVAQATAAATEFEFSDQQKAEKMAPKGGASLVSCEEGVTHLIATRSILDFLVTRDRLDRAIQAQTDVATWRWADSFFYSDLASFSNDAIHAVAEEVRGQQAEPVTAFLLGCLRRWFNLQVGGLEHSCTMAYLSFFANVAKLDLQQRDILSSYETLAHCGMCLGHKRFWIISDRPEAVSRSGDPLRRSSCACRLHWESGPQKRWSDGWAVYFLNGRQVTPGNDGAPAPTAQL